MSEPADPSVLEVARKALAYGYTVTAAAAKAHIARETLQRWLKDDATLVEARAEGQRKLEAAVLKEARKDGRFALQVLTIRSRAWQKREHVRHSGGVKVSWPNVKEAPSDGF